MTSARKTPPKVAVTRPDSATMMNDEDDVGDDDGTRETLGEFELLRRHRHRTHHVRTRRELDEWNQRVGQLNG